MTFFLYRSVLHIHESECLIFTSVVSWELPFCHFELYVAEFFSHFPNGTAVHKRAGEKITCLFFVCIHLVILTYDQIPALRAILGMTASKATHASHRLMECKVNTSFPSMSVSDH